MPGYVDSLSTFRHNTVTMNQKKTDNNPRLSLMSCVLCLSPPSQNEPPHSLYSFTPCDSAPHPQRATHCGPRLGDDVLALLYCSCLVLWSDRPFFHLLLIWSSINTTEIPLISFHTKTEKSSLLHFLEFQSFRERAAKMSRRVDDPSTINAFLRLIHATPLSASPNAQPEVMAQVSQDPSKMQTSQHWMSFLTRSRLCLQLFSIPPMNLELTSGYPRPRRQQTALLLP